MTETTEYTVSDLGRETKRFLGHNDLEFASLSFQEGVAKLNLPTNAESIELHREDALNCLITMATDSGTEESSDDSAHWWKRQWQNSLHLFAQERHISEPQLPLASTIESVAGRKLYLPTPRAIPDKSMIDVVRTRRTAREFKPRAISVAEFSDIFFWGLEDLRRSLDCDDTSGDHCRRFVRAIDAYIIIYQVDGIDPGIYKYSTSSHILAPVELGDFRHQLFDLLNGNRGSLTGNFTVVFTMNRVTCAKLNPYARALLDFSIALGSYCQSLLWFANAFGLSSLCTPAIKDSGMSKLLRLPDHVLPHYTITLGYPTGTVVPRFDLKLEGKST